MRFCVSSSALLEQLRPHRTSERVSITIEDEYCTLLSAQGPTALPVCGRHNLTATADTQRLFAALLTIEDQPITLDLHAWPNATNTLYAVRSVDTIKGTEPVQFNF